MTEITLSLMNMICHRRVKTDVVNQLMNNFNDQFPVYKIDTPLRISAFLAQTAYETGGFLWFKELGDKEYFKKYDPPSKIAQSLGNDKVGDGEKYRGMGIIMLTGKRNAAFYGMRCGLDLINHPELATEIPNAVKIACEYWDYNELNHLSDIGNIGAITRRINGGLTNIQDRIKIYQSVLDFFKV